MNSVNTSFSVFVYGTLKPDLRYHYLAQQAGSFAQEEAYLDGFDLYHLEPENYPALVRGSSRVHGWRYTYKNIVAALKVLDRLEGLHLEPPEYERVEVSSEPDGVTVWVYLFCNSERLQQPSAQHVKSGVWTPSANPDSPIPRSLLG